MEPYAIEVKDLGFSYEDKVILQDVSFALRQRDFMGILGPNGGGKTTLLKLLLGILKPDRGTIRILGQAPHDARHRVGYVAQHTTFKTGFPITALDIALMGRLSRAHLGRRYSPADRRKAEEALRKVGMWDHRDVPVGKLSGGQRQRVFIARAIATEPEILFLDEPTASVDPEFETGIYEFLRELNPNTTIVVITHDIGVVSRYVKSIACVNRQLIFHAEGQITQGMLDRVYQCPVDLVAHGIPHRVLPIHGEKS
jgi:zinc transport system ATP-binding protein